MQIRKNKNNQSYKFDKDWFEHRLKIVDITKKFIAAKMGIAGSGVAKIFASQRKLRYEDQVLWAELLKVDISEIQKHLGIKLIGPIVKIEGWIDDKLQVHYTKPYLPHEICLPGYTSKTAKCLRIQAPLLPAQDGQIVIVGPKKVPVEDCVGIFAILTLKGKKKGPAIYRKVHRSYVAGRYNLMTFYGEIAERDVEISEAFPCFGTKEPRVFS